jgi:hypothetical protein
MALDGFSVNLILEIYSKKFAEKSEVPLKSDRNERFLT